VKPYILRENASKCYACGDVAVATHNKKQVCKECYEELAKGKIKNHNVNFFGGRSTPMEDDGGPWQQNAVRDMEDAEQ
jgi:hypothetical protein